MLLLQTSNWTILGRLFQCRSVLWPAIFSKRYSNNGMQYIHHRSLLKLHIDGEGTKQIYWTSLICVSFSFQYKICSFCCWNRCSFVCLLFVIQANYFRLYVHTVNSIRFLRMRPSELIWRVHVASFYGRFPFINSSWVGFAIFMIFAALVSECPSF